MDGKDWALRWIEMINEALGYVIFPFLNDLVKLPGVSYSAKN